MSAQGIEVARSPHRKSSGYTRIEDGHRHGRDWQPFLVLCGFVSLISAVLMAYAQTIGFGWDEGVHLLAAQLIKAGKRPYLDFFFPQTALNAYWNAAWMSILGESWRVAHTAATLATTAAVFLTADFLLTRFPVPTWRLATALAAAASVGLNVMVVVNATLAQAYGLCLFLMVAAFRLVILSIDRTGPLLPGLTGLLAGAAAASSLLAAPVVLVLGLWLLIENRGGRRAVKLAAFLAGVVIAFLPLLWLFAESPRQAWFNVFEYHFFYREADWPGATRQSLEVMAAWLDSPQAFLLGLLAVAGVLFVKFKSGWDDRRRGELYLCAWLALVLSAHLLFARPTFTWYFVLVVPFLGILASAGLYFVGSRLVAVERPFVPVIVYTFLVASGLAKVVYDLREDIAWQDVQEVARRVNQVTPPEALVLSEEESIYFLTGRAPPFGMESDDSHKLDLPLDFLKRMHIVPQTLLNRQIEAGMYATVVTADYYGRARKTDVSTLYGQHFKLKECDLFWEKLPPAASPREAARK